MDKMAAAATLLQQDDPQAPLTRAMVVPRRSLVMRLMGPVAGAAPQDAQSTLADIAKQAAANDFYSDGGLTQRAQLRTAPAVVAALDRWWSTAMPSNGGNHVSCARLNPRLRARPPSLYKSL